MNITDNNQSLRFTNHVIIFARKLNRNSTYKKWKMKEKRRIFCFTFKKLVYYLTHFLKTFLSLNMI